MANNFEQIILNAKIFINDPIVIKVLGSLLQITLIIVILWWIVKKLSFFKINKNNSKIKILSDMSVGVNEKILIVDFEKVILILGVTVHSINILYQFPTVSSSQNKIKQ